MEGAVCILGNAEICHQTIKVNSRIGLRPPSQEFAVAGSGINDARFPVPVSLGNDRFKEFIKKSGRGFGHRDEQRDFRPCQRSSGVTPLDIELLPVWFIFAYPIFITVDARCPRLHLSGNPRSSPRKQSPNISRDTGQFAPNAFRQSSLLFHVSHCGKLLMKNLRPCVNSRRDSLLANSAPILRQRFDQRDFRGTHERRIFRRAVH